MPGPTNLFPYAPNLRHLMSLHVYAHDAKIDLQHAKNLAAEGQIEASMEIVTAVMRILDLICSELITTVRRLNYSHPRTHL